jgi:RecA-family ATPase
MLLNGERLLPVVRVAELASDEIAERWLVEQLWCAQSVGVIGGAPKCAKTWLGLDMALSVATGTPCLGKYAVPEPGPVLIYLAEDALPVVRERIEGMAQHRGFDLDEVAIHVITAPVLRLDQARDRLRLWETIRQLRPRLLVLDPLVRLHRIDENHAGEVAELLAYIRSLQRSHGASVLLVHHTRKNGGDGTAAGQGLRGSSDIHAFGDSNLYLQRAKDRLILSSEHRSAPASQPVYLELVASDAGMAHLEVITERPNQAGRSLEERLLDLLTGGRVLTRTSLRDSLEVKNDRLGEVLESMARAGQISRTPRGWQRVR